MQERGYGSVLGRRLRRSVPDVDLRRYRSGIRSDERAGSEPRPRPAAAQPGADADQEPRAAGRDPGPRGRAQVQTNQKRVDSTRAARELAERRLEAAEKKFAAGIETSFFVFQAQRDLAQARTSEVRAISDYNKSLVDFEAVQEVPLGGGGSGITAVAAGASVIPGVAR